MELKDFQLKKRERESYFIIDESQFIKWKKESFAPQLSKSQKYKPSQVQPLLTFQYDGATHWHVPHWQIKPLLISHGTTGNRVEHEAPFCPTLKKLKIMI